LGSFTLDPVPIPIWRWDIEIPQDWEYGQWDRIRLFPVQVNTYKAMCNSCIAESRVYPSFVMEGTTLTIQALIFITYVHATSTLTWRDMPEKFCSATNRIAHSTLYTAVHGLGKSLLIQADRVAEGLRRLHATYDDASGTLSGSLSDARTQAVSGTLSNAGTQAVSGSLSDAGTQAVSGTPSNVPTQTVSGVLHVKARLPHTRARERALHLLILPLSRLRVLEPLFLRAFLMFIKPVRVIQSALSPPIYKLYYNPH
jgi:hypothetical protein